MTYLLTLRINSSDNFSYQEQQTIKKGSKCLFGTKENRNMHNSNMLLTLHRAYPVCLYRSITVRLGKQVSLNSYYDKDRTPTYTLLVKDAVVQL